MVFSSIIFVFYFLPIFLAAYFALYSLRVFGGGFWRVACNLFLLSASLLFYAWGETWFVSIMLASTLLDYFCGLAIAGGLGRGRGGPVRRLTKTEPRTRGQRAALLLSILGNLTILGFFKYFHFGLDNYNELMGILGLDWLRYDPLFRIALPLGISFYTFQSMSYTIDVYRGEVTATRNFLDFATFVTMFPQLVAGPIVRYRTIARELVERRVTREDFDSGVRQFIIGLGKKVLIANTVAVAVDGIFSIPNNQLTPGLAWLALTSFTLQIYFDFSGYSDMAIGLGRMLGFHFRRNFNYPYTSRTMTEFWQRWHISLNSWLRDYLYRWLGGGRGSLARTCLNILIVYLLCGLWHGASWNFVVWGLFYGIFPVLERLFQGRLQARWIDPFRHVYVMLVIIFGLTLFRGADFPQAMAFAAAMLGFAGGDGVEYNTRMYLSTSFALAYILGIVGCTPIIPAIGRAWERLMAKRGAGARPAMEAVLGAAVFAGFALVFGGALLKLSAGTYNPFIYFRF